LGGPLPKLCPAYKFDEKRARTPRWVIRFTSKLQVKKKIDRRVEPPDTFLEEKGALKKIASSAGRHTNFWGISCEKSRFYTKKSYFFQF
jgi:hypothetical protein